MTTIEWDRDNSGELLCVPRIMVWQIFGQISHYNRIELESFFEKLCRVAFDPLVKHCHRVKALGEPAIKTRGDVHACGRYQSNPELLSTYEKGPMSTHFVDSAFGKTL